MKVGNFLISQTTTGFPKLTLLRGVILNYENLCYSGPIHF